MSKENPLWVKFWAAHPTCECPYYEHPDDKCNKNGWIRCNQRWAAWVAYQKKHATEDAPRAEVEE
jgi:hypothetical protein